MSKTLTIIRSNTKPWEDKTSQIITKKYVGDICEVKYSKGRPYQYKRINVKDVCFSEEIDISDQIVFLDGSQVYDCVKLERYEDFIFLYDKKNNKTIVDKEKILLVDSCFVDEEIKSTFDYLSRISEVINVIDGKKLLYEQMKKINKPSMDSVLTTYLGKKEIKSRTYNTDEIIFPFGVNASQKRAAEMALSNQISVIEGPPGTGKTQTILNIIANIVKDDCCVGIVSSNNSAMMNVQEKLTKYGYGFLTSKLGSLDNQKTFFNHKQTELPSMESWKLDNDDVNEMTEKLVEVGRHLKDLLSKTNDLAKLKEKLEAISLEKEHFEYAFGAEHIDLNEYFKRKFWNMDLLFDLSRDLEIHSIKKMGLLKKIPFMFRHRTWMYASVIEESDEITTAVLVKYYDLIMEQISVEMNEIENILESNSFDELFLSYKNLSDSIFNALLAKNCSKKHRRLYKQNTYKKNFGQFIKDYPVILSTTHSILNSVPEGFMFDYMIIDEASQVDLVTAVIAMSCCKNLIIVGDVKQLSQIVKRDVAKINSTLKEEHHIDNEFDYESENVISSLMKIYSEKLPKTLLSEHYRCNPMIIGFCNKKYYDDQLTIMSEYGCKENIPMYAIKTVPGKHARYLDGEKTPINMRQIEIVQSEIANDNYENNEIGVISPYRQHANIMNKEIGNVAIEVDTVHKFQGREKAHIIFTTVANDMNNFIDQPSLVNVAVSRAVDRFTVITSSNFSKLHGSNVGDLIRYIDYQTFGEGIIESQLTSVFDMLYSEYTDKLIEWQKHSKRISEYNSENLMYDCIQEILNMEKYSVFKCVYHLPIHRILKCYDGLNDREVSFAKHPSAHVDFIIYSRHDKLPVLAIEVDGFKFHANNEEQRVRDEIKDSIFRKKGLPLLRFATNRSGEREQIMETLDKIMKLEGV